MSDLWHIEQYKFHRDAMESCETNAVKLKWHKNQMKWHSKRTKLSSVIVYAMMKHRKALAKSIITTNPLLQRLMQK